MSSELSPAASSTEVHRLSFDGRFGEMFLLMLVNMILTIITFGLYNFWARTRTRRYIWSHTSFKDEYFEYTGTGRELWISAVKIGLIFLLFGFASNLVLQFLPVALQMLLSLTFYVLIMILIPFAIYSGRNYRLNRTRWRGIRFGMDKARKEFIKKHILYTLGTLLSLGLLAPKRFHVILEHLTNHTRFGSQNLRFTGKSDEIFVPYLLGYFFILISLGLYYPWHRARLLRYQWNHTHFGEARFKIAVTGGEVFMLYLENLLVGLLSFGLGMPWVIKNTLKFMTERIALVGPLDPEKIQQLEASSTAVGEEMADFLDVDFGF